MCVRNSIDIAAFAWLLSLAPTTVAPLAGNRCTSFVQGCLSNSTPEERVDIVNSFLDSFEADQGDTLLTLLKDQYGNYVAQQLLEVRPLLMLCCLLPLRMLLL